MVNYNSQKFWFTKTFTQTNNKLRNEKIFIMKTTIKVTANESARTFTIRTYVDGKLNNKYRTIQLSKEEFQAESNNNENDWKEFLKSSDYYLVKSY